MNRYRDAIANMTKTEYTLHHWGLISLCDATAATGNLHGRPGYPEGVEIRTSGICSWELAGDSVLLHTVNSIYCCPLREYIISGNSLFMLDMALCRSGISVDEIEEIAWEITEKEIEKLKKVLSSRETCTLFRWEGCDLPYLKQVVTYRDGQIQIDDLPHARSLYTGSIALSEQLSMDLRSSDEKTRHFYQYVNCCESILVENTGTRTIYLTMDGKKNINIPAGAIVRAA